MTLRLLCCCNAQRIFNHNARTHTHDLSIELIRECLQSAQCKCDMMETHIHLSHTGYLLPLLRLRRCRRNQKTNGVECSFRLLIPDCILFVHLLFVLSLKQPHCTEWNIFLVVFLFGFFPFSSLFFHCIQYRVLFFLASS